MTSDWYKSNGSLFIADYVGTEAGFTGELLDFTTPFKPLPPFVDRVTRITRNGILFDYREYLALLDWKSRQNSGA